MLDRNAFLRTPALAREAVEIPELGGSVFIRELTAAERDRFEAALSDAQAAGNFSGIRSRLLIMTMVDDAGRPILSDGDLMLVEALPSTIVVRAFNVAVRLSALRPEDVAMLGKGSASVPLAGSPSSSPLGSEA